MTRSPSPIMLKSLMARPVLRNSRFTSLLSASVDQMNGILSKRALSSRSTLWIRCIGRKNVDGVIRRALSELS